MSGKSQQQEAQGQSFSDAFAAARAAGKTTFIWNDAEYSTDLAEDETNSYPPTPAEIQLERGAFGFDAELYGDEASWEIYDRNGDNFISYPELLSAIEFYRGRRPISLSHDGSAVNTISDPSKLYFISFGKLHVASLQDWEALVPVYQRRLCRESRTLTESIKLERCLLKRAIDDSSGLFGGVSALFSNVSGKPVTKPDISAYDELVKTLENIESSIANTSVSYPELYVAGLEIHRARGALDELRSQANQMRIRLIEGAGTGIEGAEFVESLSFGALDTACQLIFVTSPIQEAMGRITVVLLRAAGRGVGVASANFEEGAFRQGTGAQVLKHLLEEVAAKDVPPVLADLAMSPFKPASGKASRLNVALRGLGKVLITSAWYYVEDFHIEGKPWKEDTQIAWGLRCADEVIAEMSAVLFEGSVDKELKADIASEVLKAIKEHTEHIQANRDPSETFMDAFIDNLPRLYIHLTMACIRVLLGELVRRKEKQLQEDLFGDLFEEDWDPAIALKDLSDFMDSGTLRPQTSSEPLPENANPSRPTVQEIKTASDKATELTVQRRRPLSASPSYKEAQKTSTKVRQLNKNYRNRMANRRKSTRQGMRRPGSG